MLREIPTLHITILKEIAKQPTKYVSEPFLKKAYAIGPKKQMAEQFDMAQTLVDYITDAGRLTDDVLPPSLFNAGRTALCLKNSKISGKYIKKIIDNVCSCLIYFDVSGTFQVDDNTVLYILKTCKDLRSLSIRNCRKITDKSSEFMMQFGDKLTCVDLGGCINMSYEGINKFVQHKRMSSLVELNLSGLPIQSDTLSLISGNCVNLTSLGIGYADIGEMALRDFVSARGHSLKKLCIHWLCSAVGCLYEQISAEFVFDFLGRSCPVLTELDVSGLKNISALSLQQLLDTKLAQSEVYPDDWQPMKSIKAKFIASTKVQVEQVVSNSHPYLKLEA